MHDLSDFAHRQVSGTPASDYAMSARGVPEAFEAGLVDGTMHLVEVRGGVMLPAQVAIGMHLVDCVAHGWDVAATLGSAAEFDRETLECALTAAEGVPAASRSADPHTRFGPSVPTSSASLLDRVVAALWPLAELEPHSLNGLPSQGPVGLWLALAHLLGVDAIGAVTVPGRNV